MRTPSEILPRLYAAHLFPYAYRAFLDLRPGIPFHYGHHIRAISHQLELVAKGEIARLLILMPPRHLKSHCVSVAFTAWALGHNPALRIICASYGADLAETFGRDTRRLIEAPWHRAVFPGLRLDPKKATASELRTTRNGVRLATSVGGAVTGKGGGPLIIDDPMKAEDARSETRRDAVYEWFKSSAVTRLDDPKKGAIIVVAQRLHEDDLPGRLIATGAWDVLDLPAIETRGRLIPLAPDINWDRKVGNILVPDHIGEPELERMRREIGHAAFEAQYQQAPAPAGGRIIRPEWFGTYEGQPRPSDYEAVLQSVDPAAVPGESNDYSVCTTWGLIGNHIDLLHVHRGQHLYPELKQVVAKLRNQWKPDLMVVETVGIGQSLFAELREPGKPGVRPHTPRKSKVERMAAQSAKLDAGQVRLPVWEHWKEAFIAECAGFPNGKYDDQVDSMSQALWAIDRRSYELRHCSRYKG